MRVQLVDPSAFTPPYDRSLAAALARAGAEVELLTSRFSYGPVPPAEGYEVREPFYRRSSRMDPAGRARRLARAAEHLPGMARLRREVGRAGADVVHYQWLTWPALDSRLLPRSGPRVFTLHYPLPAAARALRAQRRALGRFDAVIAHTRGGAERLVGEAGLDSARVHTIPHGPLDYLTTLPQEGALPDELAGAEGPVVLFFGLLRPYKGIEVLLDAFGRLDPGAELWICGMPRMPLEPLERAAERCPGRVRFVPRFIADPEIPAILRRADLLVLPYREIEQSGVLYAGLAFGKAMVLSDVGGFAEVGRDHGAAKLVPPGDPAALADALSQLLGDPAAREELAKAAERAAKGPFSWDEIAARTLALYRELVGG